MYPDQAPPPAGGGLAPPPPSGNSYDFIVNPTAPGKPPKSSGSGPFGNPIVMRVLLVVGGLIVLAMLGSFVQKMLFSDKTNTAELIGLTQTQTEIVRIGDQGDKSGDQAMRNVAVNTRLTLLTQRRELVVFLSKHGGVNPKVFTAKKSKKTDTRLASAKATSTFDIVYQDILTEQLTAYAKAIKTARGNALGNTEKTLLKKHYDQTQALIAQLPK
ncbi:MAG TPA: hypothetical protein VLF43_03515 [Candidatus Saccharimonadales bacterium]|nr:hypothetical protein [Candidatus Saccharimonadales bacterium]